MTLKLILIANQYTLIRVGLQLILDETTDLAIKEEASNGYDLLKNLTDSPYNFAILDLDMKGKDVLEILNEIKTKWPKIPLVIFSLNPNDTQSMRIVRNGAFAYIHKNTNSESIISILRSVGYSKKLHLPHHAEMLAELLSFHENPGTLSPELIFAKEFQNIYSFCPSHHTEEKEKMAHWSKFTLNNHKVSWLKKMNHSMN